MSLLYVSWGGSGRSAALRSAYAQAVTAGESLTFLAILDPPHFADLDDHRIALVVDELTWLLTAQLETVASESLDRVDSQVVVRVGEVDDETEALARDLIPSAVLIGAPVPVQDTSVDELVAALSARTGIATQVVS